MLGQNRLPLPVRSEPKQERPRYGRVGDKGALCVAAACFSRLAALRSGRRQIPRSGKLDCRRSLAKST